MTEAEALGTSEHPEVVYCVAAMIDLLGFSAHLEIGANDLRTTVGKAAVERLEGLESVMALIERDRASAPFAFPSSLHIHRINDALILLLDLPARVRPSIGEVMRRGYTGLEFDDLFEMGKYLDDEEGGTARFSADYLAKLEADVTDLTRFVGLVARVHQTVNNIEAAAHYPGAKTICSTGLRRRFVRTDGTEDRMAANFAFSNAYAADASLHGPHLFLEDSISELLCINRFARHAVRIANFVYSDDPFEPADDPQEGFYRTAQLQRSKPIAVRLFRSSYHFRRMGTTALTFLQLLPELSPFMDGSKKAPKSIFGFVLRDLRDGPDVAEMKKGVLGRTLVFALDFSMLLHEYVEILSTGKSASREKRAADEQMERLLRAK